MQIQRFIYISIRTEHRQTLLLFRMSSYQSTNLQYTLQCNKTLPKWVLYKYSVIYPTSCNVTQFIYLWKMLYMFRVVCPPIISSTHKCIYSIWHLSDRNCYLPLSWRSWNSTIAPLTMHGPLNVSTVRLSPQFTRFLAQCCELIGT